MLERSDGLLRGSREKRIDQLLSLKEAEWKLDTVLDLHRGLLDHAEDVRLSAIEVLKGIAERLPEPLTVTPIPLLALHLFDFTVSSGATPDIPGQTQHARSASGCRGSPRARGKE